MEICESFPLLWIFPDFIPNRFRVPPRRVWEREGTKGLLTWLRGRLGN
jgi:hypothetical protein